MKQVYSKNKHFKIEGKKNKWQRCNMCLNECLMLPEDVEKESFEITYPTFEEFYKAVENDEIPNAEARKTLFRKLPEIYMYNFDGSFYINSKNYKPVSIATDFQPLSALSFSYLAKNLKSEDFIEYCKERNFYFYLDK